MPVPPFVDPAERLPLATASTAAEEPRYRESLVFPLNPQHNHAPGIVECPNGDLLVSWYRGSGERSADDVAVYGARQRKGKNDWSEPFLMVDTPGFPDCNTTMMIDAQKRLWLFWPIILANSWESCLTEYLASSDYEKDGAPKWDWQGIIPLIPPRFEEKMISTLDALGDEKRKRASAQKASTLTSASCSRKRFASARLAAALQADRAAQRADPAAVVHRHVLGLADGDLATTTADLARQRAPVRVRQYPADRVAPNDGSLIAYMRENGPLNKIRTSESRDDGETWGPVGVADLPNPGAGIDGLRLANGHWLLIYNDTDQGAQQPGGVDLGG